MYIAPHKTTLVSSASAPAPRQDASDAPQGDVEALRGALNRRIAMADEAWLDLVARQAPDTAAHPWLITSPDAEDVRLRGLVEASQHTIWARNTSNRVFVAGLAAFAVACSPLSLLWVGQALWVLGGAVMTTAVAGVAKSVAERRSERYENLFATERGRLAGERAHLEEVARLGQLEAPVEAAGTVEVTDGTVTIGGLTLKRRSDDGHASVRGEDGATLLFLQR